MVTKEPRKEEEKILQPTEQSGTNNIQLTKFYFLTTEPPCQTDMYIYVASI